MCTILEEGAYALQDYFSSIGYQAVMVLHSGSYNDALNYGVYAMINKDERRDVSIRKPRPSIRKQLADSKQATSPKKAAARTKKNELEV